MNFLSFVLLFSIIYSISTKDVPNVKLNTGHDMPIVGLGTWQAKGGEVKQAVKDALEIGFRHIDTAQLYMNEEEVGEAINEQINAGVVKREELFITTKVWPGGLGVEGPSNQKEALQEIHDSIKRLNVSYLDLVLVHYPNENTSDIYKGLEDAFNDKLVRSIGVSNFGVEDIDAILKTAKVKPAVNQINIHPNLNQDDSIYYCRTLGIAVTGYSPLGTGSLIKDPTLEAIGKNHNKTVAQVAIRWQIDRDLIVIPKSTHKNYIKENFEVFDFKLSSEEISTIHRMGRFYEIQK